MVKGIFIPADDALPLEERTFRSYRDYQAAVDGLIEPVDIPPLGLTIYVNDEGLIHKLPFNARATFMWWMWSTFGTVDSSVLVGDAVLVGMPDDDGETTDVPEEIARALLHRKGYRIEIRAAGDDEWYADPQVFESYFDATSAGMAMLRGWKSSKSFRLVPVEDDETPPRSPWPPEEEV